jgi:hypothetical protein
MRILIKFLVCCILFSAFYYKSSLAQYNFPDYNIPEVNLTNCTYQPYIRVPGKITTTYSNTNTTILKPAYSKFIAGTSIEFNPGITIEINSCGGSGTSDANEFIIANSSCDVVIISAPGELNKYEMIELGVKLPVSIASAVNNYFTNSGTPKINPYNADHSDADYLDINAEFVSPSGQHIFRNGFFYRDFSVNQQSTAWIENQSDYPIRIRLAPHEVGFWNVTINISSNLISLSNLHIDENCSNTVLPYGDFYVSHGGNAKGYLEVGNQFRLRYHDTNESFFALGNNVAWPFDPFTPVEYSNWRIYIQEIADNGGNYFRIVPAPFWCKFENQVLGDYDESQIPMGEIDKAFLIAQESNLYFTMSLEFMGEFNTSLDYGWNVSPYKQLVTNRYDFFTDATARRYIRKKLRYISARWGYSPNLTIYEMFSEIDGMGDAIANYDNNTTHIRNWHTEMINYMKNDLGDIKHLYSTSYATDKALTSSSCFNLPAIDVTSYHYYSPDYEINLSRASVTQDLLTNFQKPTIMGEMGTVTEIEYCTPIVYHNNLWATAFMGGFGAGLDWWPQCQSTEIPGGTGAITNLHVLRDFLYGVEFEEDDYIPIEDHISFNNLAEYYILRRTNSPRAIGWIHNTSENWGNYNYYTNQDCFFPTSNGDLYCPTDWVADFGSCIGYHDVPVFIIQIPNMSWWSTRNRIDWYEVNGSLTYIEHELQRSNWFSYNLDLDVGLLHDKNDYTDIAFKIYPNNSNFRLLNDSISLEEDTLYCPYTDTLCIPFPFMNDTSGLYSFYWDFGNGVTSTLATPCVHYDTGHYQIIFIATDTLNNVDTLIENLYVPDCSNLRNQNISSHRPSDIRIFPNPSREIFHIEFDKSVTMPVEFAIFDSMGKLIMRRFVREELTNVDLSGMSVGVYNILFIFEDHSETKRLLKN